MKIVNTLIYITIVASLFGCGNSQSEYSTTGSEFPNKMPENIVMSYRAFGGYRPITYEIRISDKSISVDKHGGEDNPEKWTETISSKEKTEIYETFVRNEFDLIENEKAKGYSSDTVTEIIKIHFEEFTKAIEYEEREKPLSKQNLTRFRNIVKAIETLAKSHDRNRT